MTDINDKRANTKELQRYLYYIARYEDIRPVPVISGIYGERTENAVKAFQNRFGLSVTGISDEATWNAIVAEYISLKKRYSEPDPVYVFPSSDYIVTPTERSLTVIFIQALLTALAFDVELDEEITVDGVYKDSDVSAVKKLQRLHRLPETGNVDKITWNALANDVRLFAAIDE